MVVKQCSISGMRLEGTLCEAFIHHKDRTARLENRDLSVLSPSETERRVCRRIKHLMRIFVFVLVSARVWYIRVCFCYFRVLLS